MTRLSALRERHLQPELMDQPDLDADRFVGSLRGLRRVNALSRSAGLLWRPLVRYARERKGEAVRVLDVATGGGDVPIVLARRAQRAGLPLVFAGCDVNPLAVQFAQDAAESRGVSVDFFQCNAVSDGIPVGYDVILSSLFLHHLDVEAAVAVLARMGEAARGMVVINDLERGIGGYLLAYWGVRLLSRNAVMHVDGPRSVEGAFTTGEARALAEAAGWRDYTIERKWPFRFLLTWRAP